MTNRPTLCIRRILLVGLTLLCGADRPSTRPATQPATGPAAVADAVTYLSTFCQAAKVKWPRNRRLTIVFHGHSVPAGYAKTPEVRPFDAYPHLLHVALNARFPFSVMNVSTTAIGGEASDNGSRRFERDVLSLRPDVVFIDYALNDRRIGVEKAKANWQVMIDQCRMREIPVILLTPTVDLASNLADANDPLNQLAAMIRALAAENRVGLADSLAAFTAAASAGTPLESLMAQRNHPNRRGHELVVAELLRWFPAE